MIGAFLVYFSVSLLSGEGSVRKHMFISSKSPPPTESLSNPLIDDCREEGFDKSISFDYFKILKNRLCP
jgi:hypothetical protein